MLTRCVCLLRYREMRFRSERSSICGRCVNVLNEEPEVALHAQARLGELSVPPLIQALARTRKPG